MPRARPSGRRFIKPRRFNNDKMKSKKQSIDEMHEIGICSSCVMKCLDIIKSKNQIIYLFNNGKAKEKLIEEFIDWLVNDLGECDVCDTHDKAIKRKIKELKNKLS